MTDETKPALTITIKVDQESFGHETNMTDAECIYWLERLKHKIHLKMDETDTPA
jgi:hypothetical protein